MSSARMIELMTLITTEMPSMSAPELACTMVLAQATVGSSRRRAWLTYADFKERTMYNGMEAIARALKDVTARGFFRRCPGRRSSWELGENLFSLGETEVSQAAALAEKLFSLGEEIAPVAMPMEEDTSVSEERTSVSEEEISVSEEKTSISEERTSISEERTSISEEVLVSDTCGSTETGLQNGPNSTETVLLPYNKEKDLNGQVLVSREERARTPPINHPHGLPVGGSGNKDSPTGEGEDREIPRPRTAVQAALAEHPAAQAWLAAGLTWPGWKRLNMITARIGREPQPDQLAQAWQMWLMAGYRPGNIGGILDWYEALCRDPTWRPFYRTPGHVGASAAPQQAGAGPPPDPTMAMLMQMHEELSNGKRIDYLEMFDPA